ncbi:cellobiose phosphorylase [Candidatus Omnitrophota bacterium]
MNRQVKYHINKNGDFIIDNYNLAKPFSSFFPGIAGVWGVPMWVFYVNRGQAIASFGIKDKDHPIMEFQPANKSYYLTPVVGFHTFIKDLSSKNPIFYDAFSSGANSNRFDINNRMIINSHELQLIETNRTMGLEVDVEYFSIPNDNFGALVRMVTIRNLSKNKKDIDILDGMPQIMPYGASNMFLKHLSRTIEAWMDVENLDHKIPFLRLKVDPTDRPQVVHIQQGNFYLSFDNDGLIKPIMVPELIFGKANDFTYPSAFLESANFQFPDKQITNTKTACCMNRAKVRIKPRGEYKLYSIIGNMDSLDKLRTNAKRISKVSYLNKKRRENKELISSIQSNVFTKSSSENFDYYCAQNFLDNVMRGGYPLTIKHPAGATNMQVFSRKHGDLERDYNMFLIEPTYFSQGNGNYRDVNQNRRCDVWFNPELREEGIFAFFNLVQTDGYNPLVIRPDRFSFNQDYSVLIDLLSRADVKKLKKILKDTFTPGELFLFIESNGISLRRRKEEFLAIILSSSCKSAQAVHGEGFWSDHWHYSLDLLESYLGIYPENLRSLLLERHEFTYFDNAHVVRSRDQKYVLKDGAVYQFHSVVEDHKKAALIKKRSSSADTSRLKNGMGKIYRTSLLVKMLTIIANKFATLDPQGVGIEMESDKPNWYDSLNGLPGLLGSSSSETFELKRWILFITDKIKELGLDESFTIELPVELHALFKGLSDICKKRLDDHKFWDQTHTLKEVYREKTIYGFDGALKAISITQIKSIFKNFLKKIDGGLSRAYDKNSKLYYTYFINEVTEHEVVNHTEHLQHVKALKFQQKPLPLFLEGMVHYLRVVKDKGKARDISRAVKKSVLFDKKLKMYKVNSSLKEMPEEIGRTRVFAPGWLENESIWLHMEYKYMLELIKSGLYEEFYSDFKNVFVPFQDPARYGRSTLENSSFIASSAFPNETLHGNGFVARLSGSTAEFINIWLMMCVGDSPFKLDKEEKLFVEFKPLLASWLFSNKEEDGFKKNTFAFKFLNKTLIVYHNLKRKNTFGKNAAKISKIIIKQKGKKPVTINSSQIPYPYSHELRNSNITQIDITLT